MWPERTWRSESPAALGYYVQPFARTIDPEPTLEGEGVSGGELALSFVSEDEMAELHVRYMDEPGPTDVLSFALGEDGLLGDVVVCPDEAARNNPSDPAAELRLLVAHGVLHILGYDHERDEERAVMWAAQERYSGARSP